jgi:hypothetical protein
MARFIMRYWRSLLTLTIIFASGVAVVAQTHGVGRTPTEDEIRVWDITVSSDGKGLPPGRGTAKEGAVLYARQCASCHGKTGEEDLSTGARFPLVGGQGTLTSLHPVRTIGSYWPFATTVFDFINRAMPLGKEGSLKPDEVYALTAFLLYRNHIIKEDDAMDAGSLPKVKMPNREGFQPTRWQDIPIRCARGVCP